ncbi:hypothetical protein [Streptomyces luteireticuli]|uniref:DUF2510 domain-containing protein n=1 Tax=Streptomyces luteireticuli TaxID=173858 RepID=A0ABP3IIV3_9ACTN
MAPDQAPVRVWDGARWVEGVARVWDGKQWTNGSVRFWDGQDWTARPAEPREYATYIGSVSGAATDRRFGVLDVPPGTRVGDFVVSVCASMSGVPRLLSPSATMPQIIGAGTADIRLAVACWPWAGEPSAVWDLGDSPQAKMINLTYRHGDVTNASVTPVGDMQTYNGLDALPLMPSRDFLSLFVALTVSTSVTSYRWPEGLTPREHVLGRFGAFEISLITAETPGAGASAGSLRLNTPVDAAMYLVTIPGRSDGHPTWILGDGIASQLGTTTYLG